VAVDMNALDTDYGGSIDKSNSTLKSPKKYTVQQDVIQFIKESNRKYFVSGFDFDGSV
jgi:hypothetical protein